MTTLSFDLPDELKSYLETQAAKRGYHDAGEFLRSLVEAEKLRAIDEDLEQMLLETVDGPFTEWADADVEDIENAGNRILSRRHTR